MDEESCSSDLSWFSGDAPLLSSPLTLFVVSLKNTVFPMFLTSLPEMLRALKAERKGGQKNIKNGKVLVLICQRERQPTECNRACKSNINFSACIAVICEAGDLKLNIERFSQGRARSA